MTFLADCPRCGRRELRGARSAHLHHTGAGDVLAISCRRCGAAMTASSSRLLPEVLDGVA